MNLYWAHVAGEPDTLIGLGLGVGVTAHDEPDATLLIENAFPGVMVRSISPVNSIDDLEPNHVIPNMGFHFRRGIWFPNIGAEVA